MIRTSRGFTASTSDEHSSGSIPAGNVSSLMDISNALRTELEKKMFVRAKRLNSGTNDQRFSARVRPDSTTFPFRTATSNFESSSNSMASFTTTSDMEMTTSSRYSVMYDEKRGAGDLNEGFQAMPTAQTSLLSHEAAKHRIAIKPKNRRPKSFHPTLETSPKSLPTRPEFSLPTLPISHNHDTSTSRHSVTVVSQVEATYEILPKTSAFADARQSQPSPQSTIREHTPRKASTLAYSKSFHVARRASSESSAASTPIAASISPRLARHQPLVSRSTPPLVPPKTFSTDNEEFKKIFSKFRKHTDADSFDTVISTNFEEPQSLLPKDALSSDPFSLPASHLPLAKANSIVLTQPVHRAVERKHSASTEHHRKSSSTISDMLADVSKQPAIPAQFQSHIPSFSSASSFKQSNPILPFKKMDYFPIKQETISIVRRETVSSPVSSPSPFHSSDIGMARSESSELPSSMSPPAVLEKPSIEYRRLPALPPMEEPIKITTPDPLREDFSAKSINDFSSVPISIPDRKSSFEVTLTTKVSAPLVSPKPVVRAKSGLMSEPSQSRGEEELMKILAKRSAHLQELDGDQVSAVFPLVVAVQPTPLSKPLSPVLKPASSEVATVQSPVSFRRGAEVKEVPAMEPTFAKLEHVRSSFNSQVQRPLVPILKHLKTQKTAVTHDNKASGESNAESSLKNNIFDLATNLALLDSLSTRPFPLQKTLDTTREQPTPWMPNSVTNTEHKTTSEENTSTQSKKKLFMPMEDTFARPEAKKIDVYQSIQPFRSIFTDSSIKEKPLSDSSTLLSDLPVSSPVARRSSEPQPLKRFQPVEFPSLRTDQPPSNENIRRKNTTWRRSMFEPSKNDSSADQENLMPQEAFFPVLTTTSTKATASDDVIPYPKVSSRAAIFQQKSVADFKPLSPRNGDNDRVKSGSVTRGSIRRPAASANELSQSTNSKVTEAEVKAEVPLKTTLSQSQYPLTDSTWTASVPAVPLKPLVTNKTTKMTPLSSQVSCGTLSSTVPSWVALAHEKRKRIEMLTESSAAY
ncbi:hypothetical protein RvY_09735 [Ramazzottius varieornatus]|uniref:Uncharacterized protein n=1 Tax=Ramazzottius varieornatus TaxID=947166 RepID=A0A1D1VAE2_RAMVA|nr:hypothetical protein RvY_09735 [Ramazzottius varieornatus]